MTTNIHDKSVFKSQLVAAATSAVLQAAAIRAKGEPLLTDQIWIAKSAQECVEFIATAFAEKKDYFQEDKSTASFAK